MKIKMKNGIKNRTISELKFEARVIAALIDFMQSELKLDLSDLNSMLHRVVKTLNKLQKNLNLNS
ncbi:MAG: hypothetical protein NDF56_04565 [archaeon GB-1845-036]|nr:hypothetical protein [Candidatus Culexmicrobium thermophilum]